LDKIIIMSRQAVLFVTKNREKFRELAAILEQWGIELELTRLDLPELRADRIELVAREKARAAWQRVKKPVIVEDSGLFIRALGGFPGTFSSWCYEKIGNEGILKLMVGVDDRRAKFCSAIAYCAGGEVYLFVGTRWGQIAHRRKGRGGWGFDPIFIPQGHSTTYGQMSRAEKNRISHRFLAAKKFAQWWLSR
jgi:XTP/dITP diphosphohydrolase